MFCLLVSCLPVISSSRFWVFPESRVRWQAASLRGLFVGQPEASFPSNPGSLAIFAVIRRASSGVSNLAGAKTQKSNRGGPPLFRQGLNSAFKFRS